jgi:hypothetical protein
MKKSLLLCVVLLFLVSLFTTDAQTAKKSTTSAVSSSSKVEVYYFHLTRRCMTCEAIEAEAKKAILTLYPSQSKSKKIAFIAVNLDKKENKALAAKCKAEGQSLLVIRGNKRIDLTDQAFMYAKSDPAKLKQTLKKTIDPLLN